MGTRIPAQNERALGCLRELSRYLTVSSCTARECLTSAIERMRSDRPELCEEIDRLMEPHTAADNGCAP